MLERLCTLLAQLTWHTIGGRALCRICGLEKPAHRPNCHVRQWLARVHSLGNAASSAARTALTAAQHSIQEANST
ncbi:MAG: hypothetical protein JXR37_09225 [Kiritimatiellae bacterium]|nr:hypothetical protein [Kiritimatiellia bacterium]